MSIYSSAKNFHSNSFSLSFSLSLKFHAYIWDSALVSILSLSRDAKLRFTWCLQKSETTAHPPCTENPRVACNWRCYFTSIYDFRRSISRARARIHQLGVSLIRRVIMTAIRVLRALITRSSAVLTWRRRIDMPSCYRLFRGLLPTCRRIPPEMTAPRACSGIQATAP